MNIYEFTELSLREVTNSGKINMELFFNIAISLVDTLMEFQRKDIVNYRIYPENIIVCKDAEGYYVRLINRQQDSEHIKYMAPEEAGQINTNCSFKKDFYTIGMIFYEMITGHPLIKDDDNLEIKYFHLTFRFIEPSNKGREVPKILWEIIKKLLNKNPDDRYSSYYGLKADLEKCSFQYQNLGFINNFTLGKEDSSASLFKLKKSYGKRFMEKWADKIYRNAYQENKYILVIKGEQGTGKTTIVNELKNLLNENNDYYISVAIQKNHKMQPYFFMINGFKTLINRILMENEDNILLWRERFINALGEDVEFISEYIPEFKLILGNAYELKNKDNIYVNVDFVNICKKIIEVFTENNHLFMLCLDDIRCMEDESLNFIRELLKIQIKNFFLVCTWTGIKNSIQFKSFEYQFNALKARIEIIELEPLSALEIKKSCFGDYADSIDKCDDLCNIVKIKSEGNLYFANKFIKEINEQGLIKYNHEKKRFQYDIEKISLLPGKEKLANYIKGTIRELSNEVNEFLKIACCFREKFSICLMAELCGNSTSEMINLINVCINKDLIIELEPGEYVFTSRKIIEAVNCTMKLEERNANIIRIARCLKEEYTKQSTFNIFEILYYYNKVKNEIKEEKEILFLVKLNFEGGLHAGKSYSYSEASKYFDTAINYMESNYWFKHYELAFNIYLHTIDCLYSNSDFEKADYYSTILIEKAKGRIDKCRLYQVRIRQYTRWNKIKPAVSMAYRAINLMESSTMARNYLNKKSSRSEFRKLIKVLKNKNINEYYSLPENKNIEKSILMAIYSNLWTLGYISSKKQMCMAASLGMFKISTYYGNTEDSAFGYAVFASSLIDLGEYELGKGFAHLALMLNEKTDNAQLNCSVKFIYGDKLSNYFERLGAGSDDLEDAYNSALKCRDLVFASNSAVSMIYQKFIFGEKLPLLKNLLDTVINTMKISDNELSCLYILKNDIAVLMDNEKNTNEEIYNERDISSRHKFYFYTSRAFQNYVMGEYESALMCIERSQEYTKEKVNIAVKIMNNFIYSLILTSLYHCSTNGKKIKYKAKINQLNDNIKKHNTMKDENPLFLILDAESARINEDDIKAMRLYELAIKQAQIYEDKHFNAICNELSLKYYFSRNIIKMAAMYFNDCVKDYEYLGIKIKVKKLNEEYGKVFSTNKISWDINFNALFKSAQIISNEMDYNVLLKKLIGITMKRAGAERCCLVIERKERLYLISDTKSENMNIEIFEAGVPLENYDSMVKNVVYYVSRCRETIVIDDVRKTEFYYGDKVFDEDSVKSVLCIPICYNNKIKAILYFENNLIKGAFKKHDIEILKMFTSHTATSIENAIMYNSIKDMNEKLESTVLERTKELEITVNMLKEEAKERKAVEEALLESENRLRTLINNTSDCITFKDGLGRYVEINAAAQQLLGLQKTDYKNKTILELYKIVEGNEKTFFKIEDMDNIVKNEKREMRFNEILINEFGEENYYDIINSPIFNKHGEPKAMIVIARNITEREKAKELKKECMESAKRLEEVMEYDKMRTEFIANISHELRTPLNVILSSNQLCDFLVNTQTQSQPMERIKKYIGMTKQNCYRLLRLINNLIDITKIDSGYINSQFIKGDIVNFIEGVTMSVVTFAESKGIAIIFDTQVEEKNISFDSDKIERIMLNLLSNAIKFTPAKGVIYVNVYDYFDKISISVRDTGVGIPEGKVMEVFKRFVQLDKSFSRENEGSGIGLALVKSLVDMHKGTISLKSEIGKGSEFIVTIPAFLEETKIKEQQLIKCSAEEKIERVKIEFSDIYL